MRRVAVIVLVVAACGSKNTRDDVVDERVVATGAAVAVPLDGPAREHALPESPARAKPLPKDLACEDVGKAWSDYLHNGNRKNKDWAEVARDQQSDCERNDWPQAERRCWAEITDVASHQRCLDDFYKPRVAKRGSKPPPADPDDAFFAEDE